MKQRVLLIVRKLNIGGIQRNTINLANVLCREGHDVHVVVLKGELELTPDPGVHLHVVDFDKAFRKTGVGLIYDIVTRALLNPLIRGSGFVWRGWYGGRYFRRFVAQLEAQHGPIDRIIARGQGAFETIWSYKDPRFWQVTVSWPGQAKGWRGRFFLNRLYADKQVICNTSNVRQQLENLLGQHDVTPRRLATIGNVCDLDAIARMAEEPVELPSRPFVVQVCRLSDVKRQDVLIKAYLASGIQEDLVIVGDGPKRESVEQLIKQLGVGDRVHVIGSRINPYPWMKHARLFILSSRSEAFGIVLVESMCCGTPCVAPDVPGGIRNVLINDQARLISEDTIDSLAEKIREGLANPPSIEADPELIERFRDTRIMAEFLALPTDDADETAS